MGVNGPYTEKDLQECARCFTGWYALLGKYSFVQRRHDYGTKNFLGRVIYNGSSGPGGEKDGFDVVDVILSKNATAEYMVKKIWEYFVYENPSGALVKKLGQTFSDDGYDIRALMETIFRSKAFYSSRSMRKLVKNPIEFIVGLLRNLEVKDVNLQRTAIRSRGMGIDLLNYSNPSGLPDGVSWINSQNLINRANFAAEVITRNPRGYLYFKGYGGLYMPLPLFKPYLQARNLTTPDKIVDHYLEILVDSDVPKAVRDNLVKYMTSYDNNQTRVWDFNLHAEAKASGLVHLIAATPEYQMN